MSELLFGVEPFYVLAWLAAGTVAATGAGWKFYKLIMTIDLRGRNQNKALIELAAHSDNETDRLHPKRSENHIKETITNILAE
jgi:hypothetical protein